MSRCEGKADRMKREDPTEGERALRATALGILLGLALALIARRGST